MKIDFYLIQDNAPQSAWLFSCRLIDKAYQAGHRIFVYLDHQADAYAFDELLWSFDPQSFIPHHIQGEGPNPPPPVQIGHPPHGQPKINDVLINLSNTIPSFYSQFRRICEIVGPQEEQKTRKREHYRTYQQIQKKIYIHQV